ncbi:NADH-quinone oxidoreductase subunit J [Mycobacterium tuberculosis]
MVVYTGAVMMLFLFVLMLTVWTRGITEERCAAAGRRGADRCRVRRSPDQHHQVATRGFAGLTVANANGNVEGLAALIFSRCLWAFGLTSALLIAAAVGAMVLAHRERFERQTQRELSQERFRPGGQPTPLPNPGCAPQRGRRRRPAPRRFLFRIVGPPDAAHPRGRRPANTLARSRLRLFRRRAS